MTALEDDSDREELLDKAGNVTLSYNADSYILFENKSVCSLKEI